MKEPTYSVFVRFRSGQRLTLKRWAPLEVALRFASRVRRERSHQADDIIVVDDASGEAVDEASIPPVGVGETNAETASQCNDWLRAPSDTSAVHPQLLEADQVREPLRSVVSGGAPPVRPPVTVPAPPEMSFLHHVAFIGPTPTGGYVGNWQLRQAQQTLQGGQQLVGTAARSLSQLMGVMYFLEHSRLVDIGPEHLEQIRDKTIQIIKELEVLRRLVFEEQRRLGAQHEAETPSEAETPPESGTMPPPNEPPDEPA